MVGGDDAVVKDDVDVGLGSEAAEIGSVVLGGCLDGSDAEVFVSMSEMGARGGDVSFGIAGDGGVAIEDEITVGGDAGGVDLSVALGSDERGEKQSEDEAYGEGSEAETKCDGEAKSGRMGGQVSRDRHCFTSLLH
jgi:hypothetical protein